MDGVELRAGSIMHMYITSQVFPHDSRFAHGARSTNDISIEFELQPKLGVL